MILLKSIWRNWHVSVTQSTIDAQNQRIVNLTAEIAQSKIANGAGGDGDNDALSMIKTYINEIEELRLVF